MSFRAFVILMITSTIIAWLFWVLIVMAVNPEESGLAALLLFYFTLATGLIGTLTLLGLSYRVLLKPQADIMSRQVKTSFRHAVLLSAIAVGSLALSASNLLFWWIILVFIVVACAIEYVFLMVHESRRG
ncbi:MAG: hypothetical protein ABIB04_03095 [Patescibacteria group bacterium]